MAPTKKAKPAEQIISAAEQYFFAFEIGPRFEDSEKLTRRDLRFASSLIGFDPPSVGINWVCFGFDLFEPEGKVYFHNPLSNRSLSSFGHPANWVCFALFVIID